MPSTLFSSLETLLINKLKIITLVSIALNSSAAEALSRSVQSQYCSLVTLTLLDCRFLSDASKQLAIGVGRNTSLCRIVFSSCQLGLADFRVLSDALRDNKMLKEVCVVQLSTFMMFDKAAIQVLEQCNQSISFELKPC